MCTSLLAKDSIYYCLPSSAAGCIGAVLVLFSLSTVCIIIHEALSLQTKAFRKKVDHLNDFIRRKRIPDPLAARVLHPYPCTSSLILFRWFNSIWFDLICGDNMIASLANNALFLERACVCPLLCDRTSALLRASAEQVRGIHVATFQMSFSLFVNSRLSIHALRTSFCRRLQGSLFLGTG